MKLTELTITKVHEGLKNKEFSALELCKAYLGKIKEKDKKISAFLNVLEDSALSQAKQIDDLISAGKEIPFLAGMPCAIKDNILVEDIKCTAGSKILENYTAPYDATVIKKLKKLGAVILGKTNLDEFAMGSSTENSAFFPTRNPYDLSRVPGGSSGGSAAAVAADMAIFALGSDTGGSIRLPASFCGIVGLKPTYGTVSRYGLMAYASSLDQIGPMAKTIEDCQLVFDAIKGKDQMDSTSVESKYEVQSVKKRSDIQIPERSEGWRRRNLLRTFRHFVIGIPKEYFIKGIDPDVEKVIKNAIKKYEEMGAKIEEVSLPHTEYALACYYIIVASEASANLARFDGIKYGLSKTESRFCGTKVKMKTQSSSPFEKRKVKSLIDVYLESRGEGFGAEARRKIMLGTYILSVGHYKSYYLKAQKVRTLIKNDFDKAFEKVDVLMTPVS
ncbi:MAG: Asp-tRNA(Asn)/Glu-tRNA(Gln) amidotransferase subunit GatA, partial [bacterium]|nr:Asp-tRNA(Asn)/Glu-tRNA(Gln) amidotransferase subunit GatA [bacterium]